MKQYEVVERQQVYDEDYWERTENEIVRFIFDNEDAAKSFAEKHSCPRLEGRDIVGELFAREKELFSTVEEAEKLFKRCEPTPIIDARFLSFRNGWFEIVDITKVEKKQMYKGKLCGENVLHLTVRDYIHLKDVIPLKFYLHDEFEDDLTISVYFHIDHFCKATGTTPETDDFRVSDLHFYDADKREILNWQDGIVEK